MPPMVAVLTTIQPETNAVLRLLDKLDGRPLIVVGDKKGPMKYTSRAEFMPYANQHLLTYRLAKMLPANSYTRKNLGYLYAMETGTTCIYETDDDNAPLDSWAQRFPFLSAYEASGDRWVNVLRAYTKSQIWPRGLPLRYADTPVYMGEQAHFVYAPIQQGLASGSPDVDAIWRLTQDREIYFDRNWALRIRPGNWVPFNSQTTWWFQEAHALMYLPSFCNWRACDIIRGLIAQRVLWARDLGIVYHGAEVHQDRNEHDLLTDLHDEISILLHGDEIVDVLAGVPITPYLSMQSNMIDCYSALVEAGLHSEDELDLLYAWCDDVRDVQTAVEERGRDE